MAYNEDLDEVKALRKRFSLFCKELSKLSIKYDIAIRSIGGVDIYDEQSIKRIEYDDDWSSGDLAYFIETIDG